MERITAFANIFIVIFYALFSVGVYAQSSGIMQDWSRRHGFIDPRDTSQQIAGSWRGGDWGAADLSGEFRFFITKTKSNATNHLYVQWLSRGAEPEDEEVFYSISIDELNALSRYRFGLPECIEKKCGEIKVQAFDIFEEKQLEFTLVLEGLGQYHMKI
ncbi:MAG: hypothetical protein KTR17_05570 [Cellvibrionaceae bacterium]|nr:hypothetical protein [Cellvibrionaceae bacterium]